MHPLIPLDRTVRSAAISELIGLRMTDKLANYVAEITIGAVDYAMGYRTTAWNQTSAKNNWVPFKRFVWDVICRASVKTPLLLTTLAYISRAQPHLRVEKEDWACERVFLGALMVASKFTSDSKFQSANWALATGIFGRRDVNRVEREFLDVLNWELVITEADIIAHYSAIVSTYYKPPKTPYNAYLSPSSLSTLTTTTATTSTTTPSIIYTWDATDTPIHRSTMGYDLSSLPPPLHPVPLDTHPLKVEDPSHPNPRPESGFRGFPRLRRVEGHSTLRQHALPRISV